MTEFRADVPPPAVCYITRRVVQAQKAWAEQPGHESAGLVWSVKVAQD